MVKPISDDALLFFMLAWAEVAAEAILRHAPRPFAANMTKMHLIDPESGCVVPCQQAAEMASVEPRRAAQAKGG